MSNIQIALIAPRRSGKTTVANYLEEKYDFLTYSFGTQLKQQFHLDYPHIPRIPKPVAGYQHYGQLMRTVKSEDIWIDYCFNKIQEDQEYIQGINDMNEDTYRPWATPNVVIDDLRQKNELERCRKAGFVIVRVARPETDRVEQIRQEHGDLSISALTHSTETELANVKADYTLMNEASVENLYQQIDNMMEMIREQR